MPRDHIEQFEKDRLGNAHRSLGEYTSRAGGNDEADNAGILTIDAGEVDTTQVIYEIPDDIDEVVVTRLRGYANPATGGGTMELHEVTLNDDGTINTDVQRSVPLTVGDGATAEYEYGGEPFTDHVAINASAAGMAEVHLRAVHNESTEPASEQTEV